MSSDAPLRSPAELFDLTGRRAVVSGASSGIGRRLALVLASAGAEVLVVARRAERLEALRRDHPQLAARLWPAALDLSAEEAATMVAERARDVLGGCDVLVGAAGIAGRGGTRDFDAALLQRVLHCNVSMQAALAAALYEQLAASGAGRVIHVASIYGLGGEETGPLTPYVASKHALVGLTRSQAIEWSDRAITVNALAPGHFPTEMTEALLQNPEIAPRLLHRYPLARFGRLEELDTAALFLASPASSFITGIVLPVDGGWTCR
jgi:NAD(P)-dependent dehydrogenase (short-subunit alcohol dehydrogenase family)